MRLIKVQFFCGVCWRWEMEWLAVDKGATADDILAMIQYTNDHRHSPKPIADGSLFSILHDVELRNGRRISLGD